MCIIRICNNFHNLPTERGSEEFERDRTTPGHPGLHADRPLATDKTGRQRRLLARVGNLVPDRNIARSGRSGRSYFRGDNAPFTQPAQSADFPKADAPSSADNPAQNQRSALPSPPGPSEPSR